MATYRHFEVGNRGGVAVLTLSDNSLIANPVVHELDAELEDVLKRVKSAKVVIDFSRVDRSSTAVINSLIRMRTHLASGGGQLKLSGMNEVVRGEFQMLDLDGTVFEIHDQLGNALQAYDNSPDHYRHFKVQRQNRTFVLHLLDPRLFENLMVNELDDELEQFLERERPTQVLVNFGGVSRCATAVINSLLRLRSHLEAGGGEIKLCGLNEHIRGEFGMLQLDGTVFEIHDSASRALKRFKAS